MPSRANLAKSLTLGSVGLALLAFVLIGSYWIAERQREQSSLIEHTLNVETRVLGLFSLLQDAEIGQRGYLLLGQASYRKPYDEALPRIAPAMNDLDTLVADNSRQVDAMRRIRPLADERLSLIAHSLARAEAGDREAGLGVVRDGRGRQVMDMIRTEIDGMIAEETRLLGERRAAEASASLQLRIALLLSFLLIAALAVFAYGDGRRRLRETAAARDALAHANANLHAEARQRERVEQQLRQSQKMEAVGQLTGGIAHDFNNMLAIIIGSLDLARRRLSSDPAKAEQGIENASEGARRAAALTSRLLAFSRQQPLAPTVCDVNKLVSGMSELLRRTLGETVELETVLAGGLWKTFADCPQIENAIVNLSVNARDAMPEGGKLTIETGNAWLDDAYAADHAEVSAGQYVMLSVTDTGVGMTPEVAARAFDPFFTTKGVGRGTGLGLSQVFGFIKQSGGHAKIYSEPGQGTTVKIYLPRHTGSGAEEIRIEADPVRGGGEVILVVEDDDGVRLISVEALRELGYTVIHASNGPEALEKLAAHDKIDLLFTDIVMPGMTGRVLADRVNAERPEIKVLYATGYTRNAVVHNGMLDAGVAFLSKPFTMDQLAAKVRQVLDGRGANRPV